MAASYVSVPRDLTKVKSKVMFNLTKRQLVCFGLAALIGVPFFFLVKQFCGVSTAAICMMVVMMPFFFLAMYEKNGRHLEVILHGGLLNDMDGDIVQTDNNEEFRHLVLQNVLRGERDYSILYGYLVEFKCKGMNKQEMYDNLEEMRKNVQTEEQEDLIRDLMDFVVGYCHPKWHVFD